MGAQDPTNRRRWGPGHTRRAAGSLVALLLALTFSVTGCLPDANNDGRRVWLMVGDSNTHFTGCSYPLQLQAQLDPAATLIVDAGVFGSAAWGWIRDDTLAPLLAADPKPDGVVFALGTNDIASTHDSPEAVVDALLTLRAQASAAGVEAFIATVPPVYGDSPEREHVNQQINAANALLARELPANRLIDFHSGMEPDDFEADGVHIKPSGQEKRAAAADRALSGQ